MERASRGLDRQRAQARANPSYRAAHFGKWQWPAPYTPDAMGYDVSDGVTMNADGTSQNPDDPKLTFSITDRAEAFMEEQVAEGHPFYLQLSYYATHGPNQALASTVEKYSGDGAVRAAMTEDLDTNIGVLLEKPGRTRYHREHLCDLHVG